MYDLYDGLADLSPKRQLEIAEECTKERKDAALNAVVLGLKAMNHVHGYGLERLCRLSLAWGEAISSFYSAGGLLYRPYPEEGARHAGDILCNVDARFGDLSDRRRRLIASFLYEQRKDAQWNAAIIGYDTIRKELHFGKGRMGRLERQWEHDIRIFYEDRELYEPRLKVWIEEIGFIFEDGKLQSYRTGEDNHVIKKTVAERRMAEDAARQAAGEPLGQSEEANQR